MIDGLSQRNFENCRKAFAKKAFRFFSFQDQTAFYVKSNLLSLRFLVGSVLLLGVASVSSGQTTSVRSATISDRPAPETSTVRPNEIKDVGIEEKLGAQLNLDMLFTNEQGQKVPLRSFFSSHKPVIISPVYFSCPGLCNFHLNGLTDGFKLMDWNVGDKFQVLSISFDSQEDYKLASKKKKTYMDLYGRQDTEDHWHFLTADEKTLKEFTDSIGFKAKWNDEIGEWAHASAAIVATPDGKLSRYLPGILFDPKDIKLALNEATR
ncbi:MAG: SCO family protein, partial [Pseudobdellovibrionaceae bacterium]